MFIKYTIIILLKDCQPYYFTNENLRIGDKVFPLADGICENKLFYESDGIPYIRTDKGYSPSERYFKMKEDV